MTVSAAKSLIKNRTQKGLESTRQKIARDLPDLLATALDSYTQFVAATCDNSAKSFSAYHSACKSALGHLDGLLRLARWAVNDDATADEELTSLLTRARNAVAETEDSLLENEDVPHEDVP